MKKTRVAIISEQSLVRECLALMFRESHDFEVIGHWENGLAALPHIAGDAAEVILLGSSGQKDECVNSLLQLKQAASQARIMVLTDHPNLGELKMVFKSGAAGYIGNNTITSALLDAVRQIKEGKAFVDSEIRDELVLHYLELERGEKLQVNRALSLREQQVLLLLAQGHKAKDAASQLGLSHKTVETYKYRMMAKLSLCNITDIVRYATSQGLLQAELPESPDFDARVSLALAEE